MNLREKVEYLMQRDNLRKSDLARMSGIPYTTIDSITKRDTFENVKFSVLKSLCQVFDVDMRYLCDEEITDASFGKLPDLPPSLSIKETTLIRNFRKLSAEGKEKALDYIEDLASMDKYKKSDISQMVEKNA